MSISFKEKKTTGKTYSVEIVVLSDEFFKLILDIRDLAGELEFLQRYSCFLQVLQEPDLRGLQEHETLTFTVRAPGCSSNTMDVIARVVL